MTATRPNKTQRRRTTQWRNQNSWSARGSYTVCGGSGETAGAAAAAGSADKVEGPFVKRGNLSVRMRQSTTVKNVSRGRVGQLTDRAEVREFAAWTVLLRQACGRASGSWRGSS